MKFDFAIELIEQRIEELKESFNRIPVHPNDKIAVNVREQLRKNVQRSVDELTETIELIKREQAVHTKVIMEILLIFMCRMGLSDPITVHASTCGISRVLIYSLGGGL